MINHNPDILTDEEIQSIKNTNSKQLHTLNLCSKILNQVVTESLKNELIALPNYQASITYFFKQYLGTDYYPNNTFDEYLNFLKNHDLLHL